MANNNQNFKVAITTPVGELRWVFIQEGGKDTSMEKDGSKMQKVATIVFDADSEKAATLRDSITKAWNDAVKALNLKPTTKCGSDGSRFDEENNEISFQFKTGATLPNGKEVNIPVYNARGEKIDLGDKLIGNGSRGVIYGEAAYYKFGTKHGITLYLKALQLTHLEEYTGSTVNVVAVEDDELEASTDEVQEVNL